MNDNRLAENIIYYRKKKGLSQEKVSEYLDVSRQAVTKWETNSSRPSSGNLIKLAQLFGVEVETLLGGRGEEESSAREEVSMGRMPWVFIGISALCILAYIVSGVLRGTFSAGACICMFILCVPIQTFLHIYFSNAIKNNSFGGIAGFDDKIAYNRCEVKKLLVQMDLQLSVLSTVYVFLFCVINGANLEMEWINGILMVVYLLSFVISIAMGNYKMADSIYREEQDRRRAKRSIPIIILYTLLLCAGIGITNIVFEVKGIENNTLPAIKIVGLLLLGIASATAGLLLENSRIKKWNPESTSYKVHKVSIVSVLICVILYGLIGIV